MPPIYHDNSTKESIVSTANSAAALMNGNITKEGFHLEMPNNVKQIIGTISDNGYEAFAVGGCVRDSLLDRSPDDWDITTSALPTTVKTFFKRTIDTGLKHGTVTIMLDKTGYEVTTYRIDGEYEDGRHPKSVEFATDLIEDLKRRDFTINAMAYNDERGLIDEFDGINDLKHHLIKCVGNPKERFSEDALRMMRAIRFSAQLGFDIEENTYSAIQELAPTIKQVSMERIQVELCKTLVSDHPEYVETFVKTGLFKDTLPVIHEVLTSKYAKSTLSMLKNSTNEPVFRYAALLNNSSFEEARDTLRNLKLDNNTIDIVSKLVKYSRDTIQESEPAVREAIHKYGREFMPYMFKHEQAIITSKVDVVGIILPSKRKHLSTIQKMYEDILERGDCISIKDLDITGNDLMEYGLKGPEIGQTLNDLLHIVIENPKLNDKATLIAIIEHIK